MQAQPATILAETPDLAPPHGSATGQPVTAEAAKPIAADQSTLAMATTAQAIAAEEGGEESFRPRLEVSTTTPTASASSGMGPISTNNTVQTTAASARTPEAPVQQIADRVQVTLDQGENSATIRLQPEELGGVRIRLQVQDGQLHLSIQAEKTQTGRLLDQQLGDLRQTLESGGIKVGDLAVHAGSRTHLAGSEALGREAAQMLKTLHTEMGGNNPQHQNHQQQQAAFAGHGGHAGQENMAHAGRQPTPGGQHPINGNEALIANTTDPWSWRGAPRGVDYYA